MLKYKPTTAGVRHRKDIIYYFFNNLLFLFQKNRILNKSGRNNSGKIVVRHKGCKKKFNYFNALQNFEKSLNFVGVVLNIIYNNFYKKYYSLIKFCNGSYCYIKLIHGVYIGDFLLNNLMMIKISDNYKIGSIVCLSVLELQFLVSNVLLKKCKKQFIVASASGTYCKLLKKLIDFSLCVLILPSGKNKIVDLHSFCILGRNSNIFNKYIVCGKAGLNRNLGVRPTVRGVAMNPVDHPHGGRTKTNCPEVSPWG